MHLAQIEPDIEQNIRSGVEQALQVNKLLIGVAALVVFAALLYRPRAR